MGAYQHPDLVALDEIEDLLEAYAEAHLTPSNPVLARMRRNVLTEAARVEAVRAVERRLAGTDAVPRERMRWLARLRVPRPVYAAGFAALLAISTGAAVLAAPPGSPFFNARVALEQAFLPTAVEDRLAAHEQLLLTRLGEAQAAAVRGDGAALAAALAAYDAEVAKALDELGNDIDRLVLLEAMLSKHVTQLTAIQSHVPQNASIDKALANSQKAIAKIKEKKQGGRPTTPRGPSGGRAPQE